MTSLLQPLASPCAATDKTPSHSIRGSRSIPLASDHFDAKLQDALARIPPLVSSLSPAPSEKNQDCTDSARNYRWIGWSLTLIRQGMTQAMHGARIRKKWRLHGRHYF
jgi:hypothetical protein